MRSDSWPRKYRGGERYGDVAALALNNGRHVTATWEGRPMLGHEYVLAWWSDGGEAFDDRDVEKWPVQTRGKGIEPWNPTNERFFDEEEPWTIGELRQGHRLPIG